MKTAYFCFINNLLSHRIPLRTAKKGVNAPPQGDCADPARGPQPISGA